MTSPVVLELRVVGRITAESVLPYSEPLRACVASGTPFLALFDRRSISAPTAEGRLALQALYDQWPAIGPLVRAWADVYDSRRARSLERARQARLARGEERPAPAYPYRVFTDLDEARRWLEALSWRQDEREPFPAAR